MGMVSLCVGDRHLRVDRRNLVARHGLSVDWDCDRRLTQIVAPYKSLPLSAPEDPLGHLLSFLDPVGKMRTI
jgi:hypothetical protein